VVYSLVNGYPEHVRMWRCCQCGFLENREALWAACSNCNLATTLDKYAFQDVSLYQDGTKERAYDDEDLKDSNTFRFPAPATQPSNAADDLTSTLHQNALRLEELVRPHYCDALVPDDYNDCIETTTTAVDTDRIDSTLVAPDCDSGF
jgi:hypothetical protein